MSNARVVPWWFHSSKANKIISLWRQEIHFKHVTNVTYKPKSLSEKILCLLPLYNKYKQQSVVISAMNEIISEKSRKLANSDAQVVELSKANLHLLNLAKERKKLLRDNGIDAPKNIDK